MCKYKIESKDYTNMTIYPRLLETKALESANQFPVVAITGPRQSGKSTLIRSCFPDKPYANLESTRTLEFASSDPQGFLAQYPEGAIFDEIQKAPALLSDIQVRVDEDQRRGLFIISGSENLMLSQSISQSLAGRVIILKLLPLTLEETDPFPLTLTSLDEVLYTGFYPRIYSEKLNPSEVYGSYVETYLERDVRNLLQVKDLAKFRLFVELCAGRVGQLLNKDSLANEIGISSSTVEQWLSILEATFVCMRLQPWHANIGKRLVKTPKLYFYDVGLASYLIGIDDPSQIKRHPLRGQLFENLQIMEAVKFLRNNNLQNRFYFYRDSHGNEVDFLIQKGQSILPVEVKASQTFHESFLKSIRQIEKLRDHIMKPIIVLGHPESQERSEYSIAAWNGLKTLLSTRIG